MNRNSKVATAIAMGVVGVLSLGACSSNADQSAPERDAAATSYSPSSQASQSPTNPVVMPASVGPNFDGVNVTHSPPSRCKTSVSDDKTKMTVDCTEVGINLMGDQVFISLPDNHYRVTVKKLEQRRDTRMHTTLRDYAYFTRNSSDSNEVNWTTPYTDATQRRTTSWGVGIDGVQNSGIVHVVATITYIDTPT